MIGLPKLWLLVRVLVKFLVQPKELIFLSQLNAEEKLKKKGIER